MKYILIVVVLGVSPKETITMQEHTTLANCLKAKEWVLKNAPQYPILKATCEMK